MSTPFEYGQNFGQNFGNALGKASQNSSDRSAIDEILAQANATGNPKDIDSAMQQILSRVSAERRPEAMQLLQGKQNQLVASQTQQRQQQALQAQGFDPSLAQLDPSMQREIIKNKPQAQDNSKMVAQKAFNRISEITNSGNVGLGSGALSMFGGKSAQDTGEFSSLTGGLESLLVDKVSKGTLSNARFDYIVKTLLPKPDDSEATIKGKLKGLAEVLELDPAALNIIPGKGEKSMDKPTQKQSLAEIFG